MMKRILLMILLVAMIFSINASPQNADAWNFEPVLIGPVLMLDPCFGADFSIDLSDCSGFDQESGSTWYRQAISCDIAVEGLGGRLITEYVRKTTTVNSTDKVWVRLQDQIIIEDTEGEIVLTIWGHSYNTEYNQWGAEGMASNIIDGDFNPIDVKVKYKYSNFNGVTKICFWIL